jgi:hypothetical protein
MVIVTSKVAPTAFGQTGFVSFDVSGATAVAASDQNAVIYAQGAAGNGSPSENNVQASTVTYLTVTAGSNTFELDYKVSGSVGGVSFSDRTITVIPLG